MPSTGTPRSELRREPDVLLHGEYQGSASTEPVYLVTRGDATMQITPALFTLLDELDDVEVRADGSVALVDSPRSSEELAVLLTRRLGCEVEPDDVQYLIEEKLRPLNLVRWAGDDTTAAPPTTVPDPLLALRFRFALLGAPAVQSLSRGLSLLFHPLVAYPMVLAYLATVVATLDHGLTGAFRQVLLEPWHVVFLYVVLTLSGLWHELGHASACHRGGGRPGRIGAGLYLIWPAFFTDVSDSYRLSRGARLRTDLGGIYFNVVLGVGLYAAFLATGYEPFLLLVVMQVAEILYQFVPFIRLDGYWVVSDLTGVPDLFPLMKPAVLALRPGAEPDPSIARLRRPARLAITLWSLVTIPMLLVNLVLLVVVGPSIVRESLDVAGDHIDVLRASEVGLADLFIAAFGLLMATLPVAGLVLTVVLFGATGLRHLRRRFASSHPGARYALTATPARLVLVLVLLLAAAVAVRASSDDDGYLLETQPSPSTGRALPAGTPGAAGSQSVASSVTVPAGAVPGSTADVAPQPSSTTDSEVVTTTVTEQGSGTSTITAIAEASVGPVPATEASPVPPAAVAAAEAGMSAPAVPPSTDVQPAAGPAPAAETPPPPPTTPAPPTTSGPPTTPAPPAEPVQQAPAVKAPDVGTAPAPTPTTSPGGSRLEAHASAGSGGPSTDQETVRDAAGNTASATARSTGGTGSSAEANASAVITGSPSGAAVDPDVEEILDRLPTPGG